MRIYAEKKSKMHNQKELNCYFSVKKLYKNYPNNSIEIQFNFKKIKLFKKIYKINFYLAFFPFILQGN